MSSLVIFSEPRRPERAHRGGAGLHVDHRHLAEAVARAEDGDAHVAPAAAALRDLHLAVEHDVHLAGRSIALEEDRVARRHAHRLEHVGEALEHLVAQRAEEADVARASRW